MAKPKSPQESFYGDPAYPRKAILSKDGATPGERAKNYAEMATSPELAAYRVIGTTEEKTGIGEQLDVPALMQELRDQANAINAGNMERPEAMLLAQAITLQTLFSRLAQRGMTCNDAPAFELNMRVALRAQSQCRATVETLAAMKNPPVVYARQVNVTSGPQQVNNGVAPSAEKRDRLNELLELANGERLDSGATGAASEPDKELATVGKIDGAADG